MQHVNKPKRSLLYLLINASLSIKKHAEALGVLLWECGVYKLSRGPLHEA